MNTDEFLSELQLAYASINKISNAIASPEGITHNAEYGYLKDKMDVFCNTADHIKGQLKNKLKEQNAERSRIKKQEQYNKNKKL